MKNIKFNQNNEVLSFFMYMWNKFSIDECKLLFNSDGDDWEYSLGEHIWNMWEKDCYRSGATAVPAELVAELDEKNLNKIIQRACELYDGRNNRQ